MRFKEGDYVKVRAWKDMENEFGLTPSGFINTYCYFVKIMRFLCGKILYIKNVNPFNYYTTLLFVIKGIIIFINKFFYTIGNHIFPIRVFPRYSIT